MHGSFLACIETLHSPGSNGPGEVLMVSTPGMYDAIRTTEVKGWIEQEIVSAPQPVVREEPDPEQASLAPEGFQIFESEEFGQVRVVAGEDGAPWFIAKDVAEVLGYKDPDQAIRKHCKSTKSYPVESTGQVRYLKIIPESDVYRLIMRSKLPQAEAFQDWVTTDILPTIRKHGAYASKETIEEALADPDSWIRVLEQLKTERAEKARIASEHERDSADKNP